MSRLAEQVEELERQREDAMRELETARNSMMSSSFHGRERIARAQDALNSIRERLAARRTADAEPGGDVVERVRRTMTDPQRMIWRDDVEGICSSPDICFEYGERVRCAPCAIEQAMRAGVDSDLTVPNLPEVCRLKRELASLNATQPTDAEVREVVEFSGPIPGHWETADGSEMANRCLGETREQLSMSHLSDMTLANQQYLVSRESLDLIHYQTAAKERIRWLSAQLARANILLERLSPAAVRREERERCAKIASTRHEEWVDAIKNGLKRMSVGKHYASGSRDEAEVIAAAIRQHKDSDPQ